jgi:hypothetical protein
MDIVWHDDECVSYKLPSHLNRSMPFLPGDLPRHRKFDFCTFIDYPEERPAFSRADGEE